MKRKRTPRWLTLLAAASVVALTACSTASTPSGDKAGGKTSKTLTVWAPALMSEAARAFPKGFEKAEPGVTVNVVTLPNPFEQNVLTKIRAGEKPDILYFHGIGNWLAQLDPATNLTDLSDMAFVGKTLPGVIDHSTSFKGVVYGAVVDFPGVDGALYNRKVFSDLGLTIPKNAADLEQVCKKILASGKGVAPIGMAGGDSWPLQILPFMLFNDSIKDDPDLMTKVNTNKASFSDPQFVDAFAETKKLSDMGCFNKDAKTMTFENSQKALIDGKVAMFFAIANAFAPIFVDSFGLEKVNQDVGFFPLSMKTDVSSWQMTGQAIYVPKQDNKDQVALAKRYIDWFTGPGYQSYVDQNGSYPVIQGATADEAKIPTITKEAKAAFDANTVPQYQQTLLADYGDIAGFTGSMLFQGKSPQWVGDQMAQTFARNAKAQGLPGF